MAVPHAPAVIKYAAVSKATRSKGQGYDDLCTFAYLARPHGCHDAAAVLCFPAHEQSAAATALAP
jgi:hypothetical protein